MTTEEKQKLLEEFAEYAHTYYLGCGKVMKDGEMIDDYSYKTQVINMVGGFLDENKEITISQCVFCDMSLPFDFDREVMYDKNSATWGEHIKNHNK